MKPSQTALGEFLRNRRIELGLKQSEVAELLGMSQANYGYIERGEYKTNRLDDFARTLECDRWQLIELLELEPEDALNKLIWEKQKELGFTLRQFAKKFGINYSTLYKLKMTDGQGISYYLMNLLLKVPGFGVATLTNFVTRRELPPKGALGILIRGRRKKLGISQPELAKKVGMKRQYLSRIELGICLLNSDKSDIYIDRFAKILKMSRRKIQKAREAILP